MQKVEIELKELVARERELLHEILLRIREIDQRELYFERGYSSLFDYLTREIGYAPASAQRRIDAVRLSREVPEVIEQVATGALNLTQIGLAQKGFRRKEVPLEEKRALLQKIVEVPLNQAEQLVARELQLPVEERAKVRGQADGSVRMELTLCVEGYQNLQRVRELMSHSVPQGDFAQIMEKALKFYLSKKDPERKTTSAAEVQAPPLPEGARVGTRDEVKHQQEAIPASTRRQIYQRDKSCTFTANGKRCGSRHQLEIDHRQMRYHGGGNEPANLRLLCRAHNQWLAKKILRGEGT